MFYLLLLLMPCSFALVDITSTYYTRMNEGLNTLSGDDIWSTACTSCGIFNLSYNSFTSTDIATFDFRNTTGGIAYEDNVKTLILSHNRIVDPSLGTLTQGSPSSWILEWLDLSYNMITDLTSFPRGIALGDLVYLNFEHNLIFELGDHNIFQPYFLNEMIEINMENNRLKIVPTLSTGTAELIDTKVGMKNNEISALSPDSDCSSYCGNWWLRKIDWQNNRFTEESFKFEDHVDPEIYNFNYNKFTSLFPIDLDVWGYGYNNMKKLYIADNDIETINHAEFDHLDDLVMLDLKNNKIVNFAEPNLDYPRSSPLTIDLRGKVFSLVVTMSTEISNVPGKMPSCQ